MSRESINKEIQDLNTQLSSVAAGDAAGVRRQLDAARARLAALPPQAEGGLITPGAGGGGASGKFRRDLARLGALEQAAGGGSMAYNPSMETLKGLECVVLDSKVATEEQLSQISQLWTAAGAPGDQVGRIALDIAIQCMHNGSSRFTRLKGMCPLWPVMPRAGVCGIIQQVCTLRQFCMYYAKIVWVYMIENEEPPSSWAHHGYNYNERYAAFDFFQGVLNRAALQPVAMTREPTPAEIQANKANGAVAINDAVRAMGIKSSSDVRITGGNIGLLPHLIEAPDDD